MNRISDRRIFICVCLNIVLYILILTLDITKAKSFITPTQGLLCDVLKYAAIISCLLICVFALSHERKNVAKIQMIVFSITLVADLFLLFTPHFSFGVLAFIGAHSCALLRYKPKWLLPIGIAAAAIFTSVFLILPKTLHSDFHLTLVLASCSAYAIMIISVTISTFHARQPRPNELFSRIGMLLFLACDINVAIYNGLPVGSGLYTASIFLMWLFYLPAQTMLALSATDLPLLKKKQ
jgi:hypothetical protein